MDRAVREFRQGIGTWEDLILEIGINPQRYLLRDPEIIQQVPEGIPLEKVVYLNFRGAGLRSDGDPECLRCFPPLEYIYSLVDSKSTNVRGLYFVIDLRDNPEIETLGEDPDPSDDTTHLVGLFLEGTDITFYEMIYLGDVVTNASGTNFLLKDREATMTHGYLRDPEHYFTMIDSYGGRFSQTDIVEIAGTIMKKTGIPGTIDMGPEPVNSFLVDPDFTIYTPVLVEYLRENAQFIDRILFNNVIDASGWTDLIEIADLLQLRTNVIVALLYDQNGYVVGRISGQQSDQIKDLIEKYYGPASILPVPDDVITTLAVVEKPYRHDYLSIKDRNRKTLSLFEQC